MATQYEIEHAITPETRQRTRRVDMSSFTALLDQISTHQPSSATAPSSTSPSSTFAHLHNNPHATPTPVDVAAAFRLVQEQMETLARTAPTDQNREFLLALVSALDESIADPPKEMRGVGDEFLASLDRVPRKRLGKDENCSICAERFLDDKYALVVELPCHRSHRFDLECVAPWLQSQGTCPMCRKDFVKKTDKKAEEKKDQSEDEDDDVHGMFG